jgi:hypothetical protein
VSKARTLGRVALVLSLPLLTLLAGAVSASVRDQGSGPAVQERPGGGGQGSLFPAFKPSDPVVERGSPLFWAIIGGLLFLGLLALLAAKWRPLHWLAGTGSKAAAETPH